MQLKSPVFNDNGRIPEKYTIDGEAVSPPLYWVKPPLPTRSFALLMDDIDVPKELGGVFRHWMVYDIPGHMRELKDGASPDKMPAGAKELPNTYTQFGMPKYSHYGPPWPPTPDHRYVFTLFALKVVHLGLAPDATYEQFMEAVQANTIEAAKLTGVYGPAKTPLPTGESK